MFNLQRAFREMEEICDTRYDTRSARAEAVLDLIDTADRPDDKVRLLAEVLSRANSAPEAIEMPTGLRCMSDRDWKESFEKLGTKPVEWAERFKTRTDDLKTVADFVLSQIGEYTGNTRAVALAVMIQDLAPYAQLSEEVVGHNHDELLASLRQPLVREVSAMLHSAGKRGDLKGCQILTLLAKKFEGAKTPEDRLGMMLLGCLVGSVRMKTDTTVVSVLEISPEEPKED